jgi:hypothetical protein
LLILISITHSPVLAQIQVNFDSTKLKLIRITHVDEIIIHQDDKNNYQRLIGAVVIEHEGITMTCDSAHFYADKILLSPSAMSIS